jgi:hypothetical protein
MKHTLKIARAKALNDANFLGRQQYIFVYNENCPGMQGHHIVVDDKEHYNTDKNLTYIEIVKPNGSAVKFSYL